MTEHIVLDEDAIRRSTRRIAHEILEHHPVREPLAFIGIQTRGVPLAERLFHLAAQIEPERKFLGVGALDISFHRDDIEKNLPMPKSTDVPFDINEQSIVLVDDVFFTGRTIRSAMNALNDLGRPRRISLAVLVDRGHRQLPIRADYIGKNIPTSFEQKVVCRLTEVDGQDAVYLKEAAK